MREELSLAAGAFGAMALRPGAWDVVVDGLCSELREALGSHGGPGLEAVVLGRGWQTLTLQAAFGSPAKLGALASRLLDGATEEGGPSLPDYAGEQITAALTLSIGGDEASDSQRRELLGQIARSGTLSQRLNALVDAPRVFGEKARPLYEGLLRTALSPAEKGAPPFRRRVAAEGLLKALRRHAEKRPQDPWLPEVAAEVFGWNPAEGRVETSLLEVGAVGPDEPLVRWAASLLPADVRARLEAAGKPLPGEGP